MSHEELLVDYAARKDHALGMGGPAKLEKRRAEGVLNARERLELLLDPGTFEESGLFAVSHRKEVAERTPADGKIAGYGKVQARKVAVVANDFTVMGASSSVVNGKKIRHMREVATKNGLPLIFLGESTGGARMPDRMGAEGRAILGQDPYEYRRLRETPWVSALLGPCYGSSTWYACLSDFVVMRRGATMAVASGRVTSKAIRQEIDSEELGGWRMHTQSTGLVDALAETDEEALEIVKKWLAYFPSNQNEPPPRQAVTPESVPDTGAILQHVPTDSNKVYDVRKAIDCIVDRDSVMELKARFGRSICTMVARLDGHPVGILASNPMFKGGAIDVDACNKAISFLVLCDSFNIPLVVKIQ
ncbi:acyl-CoA carboxylase subunit beta (plasmid) [Bordetella pertussis]